MRRGSGAITSPKATQRGLVIVDRGGQVHALARQVIGAKTKDVRAMLAPLSPDQLPSVKETRKRIADQLESEKLDDNSKPHLRRTPQELKARQRQRRTALQAQWQHMEIVQRAERMSLHAAQKRTGKAVRPRGDGSVRAL